MTTSKQNDIVHFISLNVQGLRNKDKRVRFVFIQETHFTIELEYLIKQEFNEFYIHHSYGTSNSRGVSILISKKLNANVIDTKIDDNGRYILINIELEKSSFSLLNLYAPNDQRLRNIFFKTLDDLLKQFSLGLKILSGDYNQKNSEIDRYSKNNSSTFKANTHLNKLIKSQNLIDIWRDIYKNKTQFTWRRRNNTEKSRIDYFLIDFNLRPSIFKTDIRPAQISYTDHQAVSLKIYISSNRGPNYWKINNMYLKDEEYIKLINQTIDESITECKNSTNQDIWDYCKLVIKEKSISYAKIKSMNRKNKLFELENRLKNMINLTDETQNELLKNEIKIIEKKIVIFTN